jgi:hypothetical protein
VLDVLIPRSFHGPGVCPKYGPAPKPSARPHPVDSAPVRVARRTRSGERLPRTTPRTPPAPATPTALTALTAPTAPDRTDRFPRASARPPPCPRPALALLLVPPAATDVNFGLTVMHCQPKVDT